MSLDKPVFISAVLLAAGESSRMGEPKQLLPFGRSTFIEQAVDTLLASAVAEVIVVVGHRAEAVVERIGSRAVRIAQNPEYRQGMITSIIAGLKLVAPEAGAIMLALSDQPLLNSRTIDNLIRGFLSGDKGIAIPTCRGIRGHPVIFAPKYIQELMRVKGDIGGRQIIDSHPEDVLEVDVASEGIIVDIDNRDDYRHYLG
ncbi:MAG: molybdenum cofactor cytidylyltransferase [Dehalococcoidales bacterium]|nr:molybdenum cofactor cytidylyltransferase [Dehalococcoidales bacterium]